jgi:phage baseplate assembly protein W
MLGKEPDRLDELFGLDLRLNYRSSPGFYENADLSNVVADSSYGLRDIEVARGIATLKQAIVNRLKTHRGELAPLGHPDYGSRHHELIGEPNVERTRNLVKLYVLQALKREARIEKVTRAVVSAEHIPPRSTVRLELEIKAIGSELPLNIIVPFDLAGNSP